MKYLSMMFAAISIAFFAGCVPGEVELLIKTSALNKVMCGGHAEILAGVKDSFVISNANDKVSIALKGIETNRDLACALTNFYSRMFVESMLGERAKSGERNMSFVMEERKNDLPILKMEAKFPASLKLKGTGPEASQNGGVECMPTILCLDYDSDNGCLEYSESTISNNSAYAEYLGRVTGAYEMFVTLKNINNSEKGERPSNSNITWERMVMAPLFAGAMTNVSFFVEGDDDKPIFVVGENVKVNDKPVADYQAWIRKGDKVCITLLNEKSDLKSVQFFESEAQAKAVKKAKDKVKQAANKNVK